MAAIWHFIDLPIFLTEEDENALKDRIRNRFNLSLREPHRSKSPGSMNIMQAIAHSKAIAFDPGADAEERALYLSWLIHLAGDLHQPLHTASLFSRRLFPDGDQGGNKILTEKHKNLHSLWDGFPGSPRFSTTRNHAIRLMEEPQMRELGERSANDQDFEKWLDESHSLGKDVAYGPEVTDVLRKFEQSEAGGGLARIELSEAYLRRGGAVATRRLVQAGYRLGQMLEALP